MQDTLSKFTKKTVALHWIVAIVFIALLIIGIYMVENEAYELYGIHKSVGVIILLFAIYRVIWRMSNGFPKPLGSPSPSMHKLAKFVHYLLIIGTILMPISGIIMSAMGGYGVAVFGLELVAANPDPSNPMEMIAINESIAFIAHTVHGLGGNILMLAVILHIAGALKHHIIDKDGTLKRMLGNELK